MVEITRKQVTDYFFNLADADTSRKVEAWFLANGRSQEAHDLLYSLWNELEISSDEQSLMETRKAYERFCNRLAETKVEHSWKRVLLFKKRPSLIWLYRAAVIILFPLLILSVVKIIDLDRKTDIRWVEKYVACGDTQQIILPDGTTVHLNSDTRIYYPEEFAGSRRQVIFSGEAYFDVAKKPEIPFEIRTEGSLVKVLGTEFNLKSYPEDSEIEVCLFEGAVSFLEDEKKVNDFPILLKPGEKIVYDKSAQTVDKSRFDLDNYTSWEKGEFYFKNCPLEDIVRQLERHFNRRIVISTESLKTVSFYMAFVNDESLEEILNVLSVNENIHVKDRGAYIEIY